MRLALVGDLHLFRLWIGPWRLLGKRAAGQANVWLRRRKQFMPAVTLPRVFERVIEVQPDHLLFSGDITSSSLPSEFRDARRTLAKVIASAPTVIVPGNHDRYTHASLLRRRMERAFPIALPRRFPHMLPLSERWALVALNSATPRLMDSCGRLGKRQLGELRRRVQAWLDAPSAYAGTNERRGLVMLCHYPFALPCEAAAPPGVPGEPPMPGLRVCPNHALIDAHPLAELIRDWTQQHDLRILFLHGHIHYPWCWEPMPGVVDINAGSPSHVSPDYPMGQGFWEINLPGDGAQSDAGSDSVTLTRHIPRLTDNPEQVAWECRSLPPCFT